MALGSASLAVVLGGCHLDMYDQPRYEPLEESSFFDNGQASRRPVPGTIARGQLQEDGLLSTGQLDGKPAAVFPFEVDRAVLERGRMKYDIFCTPCHGRSGNGQGVVVQRGLKPPPSFHLDRLRDAPPGHFFTVITEGFGIMYDHADRISPKDRWAIVAYIRALQLSQNARISDVPPGDVHLLGRHPMDEPAESSHPEGHSAEEER